MEKRTRRKTLIVNKLQLRMIIAVLGLIFSSAIILVASLFFVFKDKISTLSIPEETVNQFLADSILPIAVIAVVLFGVTVWAVVLISHKIYGPLYRFGIYIRKLSDGEPTDELKFRKDDAVNGLKEVYNDLRQAFEKALQYDYKEMISIFSELQNILDKVYNKKFKNEELSQSLQAICDRIAKALDVTSEVIE